MTDYDPLDFKAIQEKLNDSMTPEYKEFIADLTMVANTPAGARFICALLGKTGAFEPAWTAKNADMAKNTVLKDFGQDLLDDLSIANDKVHDQIQLMMRVRRKLTDQFLTQ